MFAFVFSEMVHCIYKFVVKSQDDSEYGRTYARDYERHAVNRAIEEISEMF